MRVSNAISLLALAGTSYAQFPPTPEGVTEIESKFGDGVRLSWKENDICETTEGVRSYTGYVHLPPGSLDDLGEEQDYNISTFFWFFEARKEPENAPMAIWMNGGPGSSSMLGLFVENGPCYVHSDSNSTYLSEYSWNNEVNMLFLDQPVQVGLSYDTLQNITNNLVTGDVEILDETSPIPEQNTTFLLGTYPSQDGNQTALGSVNAAKAAWHFLQTFTQEFPAYHPNDSRISIATESYGGRYGPAFTAYFEEQNQKIANGTFVDDDGENALLHIDTLMIINGCIDRLVQWPAYPTMAHNNTYGIQAVNESQYLNMTDSFERPGACRDQIIDCREAAAIGDPENLGINATVNDICEAAESFCRSYVLNPYILYGGRNYYDIATLDPAPTPPSFYEGFLNQEHVQREMGVPLNWTQSSGTVSTAFRSIGDYPRDGWLEDLAFLLDSGIKVALVYGDRDYACNWYGGELVSLAIPHTASEAFSSAGYSPIHTNATYTGGQVRQHGNLSFSRVYQAGHEVPAYQPETAYEIFMRVLFNKDISTGLENTGEGTNYSSVGPNDTLAFRNEQFEQPLQFCYTLDPGSTCTEAQIETLLDGSATVCSWIVKDKNSSILFPDLVGEMGVEGCGRGNGSLGGGNGTVGNGSGPTVPFEGAAVKVGVSLGMVLFGTVGFLML